MTIVDNLHYLISVTHATIDIIHQDPVQCKNINDVTVVFLGLESNFLVFDFIKSLLIQLPKG